MCVKAGHFLDSWASLYNARENFYLHLGKVFVKLGKVFKTFWQNFCRFEQA